MQRSLQDFMMHYMSALHVNDTRKLTHVHVLGRYR